MENVRNTKISTYYRRPIDSGIWERLEVEKVGRINKWRNPAKKETAEKLRLDGVSSLSGGLVTLFILCGGVVCLAASCFIVECHLVIWKILNNVYIKLYKRCRKKTVVCT